MIDRVEATPESDVSATQLREEIRARGLTEDEWQHFLAKYGPAMLPADERGFAEARGAWGNTEADRFLEELEEVWASWL
jgi:hypothetical protein